MIESNNIEVLKPNKCMAFGAIHWGHLKSNDDLNQMRCSDYSYENIIDFSNIYIVIS